MRPIRKDVFFLDCRYVIEPLTDISHIILEERACECGCEKTFRAASTSPQRFAGELCKERGSTVRLSAKERMKKRFQARMNADWNEFKKKREEND